MSERDVHPGSREPAASAGEPAAADVLADLVRALADRPDARPALARLTAIARRVAEADVAYVVARAPGASSAAVLAVDGPGEAAAGAADRDWVEVPLSVEGEVVGHLVVGLEAGRPAPAGGALERLAAVAALAVRQDHLVAALAGTRDPSELRAGEPARLASRLRRIVDTAKDGIITSDVAGSVTWVNPAGEAMFGYPPGELVGQPLSTILPALALTPLPAADAAARLELEAVRRDGSRFPAELSVSTLEGTPALVVVARDVTERKAAERAKDEFVATVSHELRTPLTALRGHIELILDGDGGPVTETQQRFLNVAIQSADRLGALINDLLDVARIEAGKVQVRRELVDLEAVLRDVAATFRVEAQRRGLGFREEWADLPPVVGDRDRLVQVFGNLVSNAIKYTPAGEVGIQAWATYGAVEVVVHDTGIGMNEAEQHQLFTKFFRSRARAGPDPGGTGLGLVIAKGIVEAHGGTISVESAHGRGSRFRVVLPAEGGQLSEAPEAGDERATVLVVDDEVTIRDLLLEYLRLWGYRGVPARDGAEGLALAQRLRPQGIILDVGMLPMSGLEVLRRLKQDPRTRDIPVLLHSVTDQPDEGLTLGAADFLQKPVNPERLRAAIQRALAWAPVPVFVADGDDARRERLRQALEGTGVVPGLARTLAEARAIPRTPPPIVLLGAALADGPSSALLAEWRADPGCQEADVILVGPWTEVPPPGPGCRVDALQGQRAADAAAQVHAVLGRRRAARAQHG
jgi:PAS domain S-box-containing protein